MRDYSSLIIVRDHILYVLLLHKAVLNEIHATVPLPQCQGCSTALL
uniref:Uncharacterized protein n=1 Tax=Anguilla anguilla TaxID=7936 RepID=A0A0E9UMF9_ANGAN